MKTRVLGLTGPEISVIGLGTWAIGGPWQWGWGGVDDNESIDAIQQAIDGGINWIDTAAVYGFGHSEKIVGQAVKYFREKVFIATKGGMINDGTGKAYIDNSPKSIREEVENSIKRLGTDYIDLYQIHWPDPNSPVEKTWEEMAKLKEEGKVNYIGVSNFKIDDLKKCLKISHVQSLQPPYSMLRREYSKEILPFCLENGIGVVAYSPMQAGLLTGKFDISKVADDDWRKSNKYFQQPYLENALRFVESLKPIAEKNNTSVGNIAIAWVLKNDAVTSAIVGSRNKSQSAQNNLASELILSDEDYITIKNLLNEMEL